MLNCFRKVAKVAGGDNERCCEFASEFLRFSSFCGFNRERTSFRGGVGGEDMVCLVSEGSENAMELIIGDTIHCGENGLGPRVLGLRVGSLILSLLRRLQWPEKYSILCAVIRD